MVVDRKSVALGDDRLFQALADPTRRDIVARTMCGEHSVSGLARFYPMSVTAVQKHVGVLEAAGLVSRRRHGRESLVRGNVEAVRRAQAVLDSLEELWRGRVDRMADILAAEDDESEDENPGDKK